MAVVLCYIIFALCRDFIDITDITLVDVYQWCSEHLSVLLCGARLSLAVCDGMTFNCSSVGIKKNLGKLIFV